jgi:hypothetical protein
MVVNVTSYAIMVNIINYICIHVGIPRLIQTNTKAPNVSLSIKTNKS